LLFSYLLYRFPIVKIRYVLPLITGLALGGCAVYVPTVPSTPLLEKGQVELTAGLRGFNSFEAGAAWAPTGHLLVSAESGFQGSTTETTTNGVTSTYQDWHRQVGLGLGYYRAPSERLAWYLAAVGGVGVASVSLHSIDFAIPSVYLPIPLPYVSGHYEAQYWRYYGQLYAARPLGSALRVGASLRGTFVDYSRLTFDGQPLASVNRLFLEPTLFVRVGHGVIQGQGTLGLSLPTRHEADESLRKRTAPVSALISVGVVFRPDLLNLR